MISDKHSESLINKDIKWRRIFLLYTLLFAAFTVGIFAVLIITHRSVMQFHDAYKQGAFRLIEMRNQMSSIADGDGFAFWSWYEGPGLDESLEYFVDPCSLIGSLFPIRYIELGFTIAALLRMYLGGLSFIVLGREVNLGKMQSLIGAVLYTFSACFIGLALRQSEGLVNAYLFPLLIISVDRIYKGKSPLLFVLTVAYYCLWSIYFAYMSAIVVIIYIMLRYAAYNDAFVIKDYLKSIGSFIWYGGLGVALSIFSSAFSAFTIMRASTESSNGSTGLIFDTDHYLTLGKMILGTGATYDYSDIGPHILILMLLPIAIRKCSKKATNTIMTILLFVMILIPFFCSMFNGFGYVSFRWTYCLLLFAVWSAAEQLDIDVIKERGSILLAALALILISAWTIGLYTAGMIDISRTGKLFVPLQLASGLAIIILFGFMRKKGEISKGMYAALFIIPLVSLSAGWSFGFANNIENFAKNSTVFNKLSESTLRVGPEIDDGDFYRIDSVDAISRHEEIKFPSNENIWWKTNNLIIYNSRIPQRMTDFSVDMGNSYGYARRVFNVSNGNRWGLDFLYGVRYFLGNDTKKEGCESSDNYAGYGFEKYAEIDGVTVFKSKYDAGIGFVLGKAIKESEFNKLGRPEKEQALLQAAVVPDDQIDKCAGVQMVTAEELDLDIKELPFEVIATDGLTYEEGIIQAEKKDASLTIRVKDAKACQLMLSFDNLLRNSSNGKNSSSYEIVADDGKVKKYIIKQNSRQGVLNTRDHSLGMGYYDGPAEIKISLSAKGNYTFEKMYVSAMSSANYDKYAAECASGRLKTSSYNNKIVEGVATAANDGILFLSIPAYDNWDVYVDGEKADRIDNLDETFTGVSLSKGKHEIKLKYNNRYVKYGSVISILALILLIASLIRRRKTLL